MIGPRKRNVQRGRGIGSILSSIFSKIAPIARTILNIGRKAVKTKPVQEVLKSAKNEAIKTGLQVADDVFQGKNVVESIKSNAESGAMKIAESAINEAKKAFTPPQTKKRTAKKMSKTVKKVPSKRRKRDIFAE